MVDTSFAPRGSPRPAVVFNAMSPSSTGHGGHYNTKDSLFDQIVLLAVFVGERLFVFLVEPACGVYFFVVLCACFCCWSCGSGGVFAVLRLLLEVVLLIVGLCLPLVSF